MDIFVPCHYVNNFVVPQFLMRTCRSKEDLVWYGQKCCDGVKFCLKILWSFDAHFSGQYTSFSEPSMIFFGLVTFSSLADSPTSVCSRRCSSSLCNKSSHLLPWSVYNIRPVTFWCGYGDPNNDDFVWYSATVPEQGWVLFRDILLFWRSRLCPTQVLRWAVGDVSPSSETEC